jgi:hypothetical protein
MPPTANLMNASPEDVEAWGRFHERSGWVLMRLAAAKRSNDVEVIGACLRELESLALRQERALAAVAAGASA